VSENIFGVYRHDLQDRKWKFRADRSVHARHGDVLPRACHALHHRTGLNRNGKSDADKRANETVAEISAAVLVRCSRGGSREASCRVRSNLYGAKQNHLLYSAAGVNVCRRFGDLHRRG
jgi:hypothetical protein